MDWPTVASLATAGGTLVLAFATFDAVRSANRAARVAERSLLAGLRPLFLATRPQDPPEKIMWADQHFAHVDGNRGVLEQVDDVFYLACTLRNAGAGIGVLHGWFLWDDWRDARHDPVDLDQFRQLTRDLYIPPGDTGFWQGAIRESDDPDRPKVEKLVANPGRFAVDLLYGDAEGGQRTITRFGFTPIRDGSYLVATSRHWNIDRPDPR